MSELLSRRLSIPQAVSAARVVGFGYPARLIALLYDHVIALSVDDPLRLWLLVTGVHHEPAGVGADTLVLAQSGLDDVMAVWASALTQERCRRALLGLPERLLDCLIGLARHRLVFGDASLAILIHHDDPTPRTPCSPAPGGQPDV